MSEPKRVTVSLTPAQLRAVHSAVMDALTAMQQGDYVDASVRPDTLARASDAVVRTMQARGVALYRN